VSKLLVAPIILNDNNK